jgi:hypothetical protein
MAGPVLGGNAMHAPGANETPRTDSCVEPGGSLGLGLALGERDAWPLGAREPVPTLVIAHAAVGMRMNAATRARRRCTFADAIERDRIKAN